MKKLGANHSMGSKGQYFILHDLRIFFTLKIIYFEKDFKDLRKLRILR